MEHLLSDADAGLIMTFFSCGQSMFIQCYTVALHKRLIRVTVHAGTLCPYFPRLEQGLMRENMEIRDKRDSRKIKNITHDRNKSVMGSKDSKGSRKGAAKP